MSAQTRTALINSYANVEDAYQARATEPIFVFVGTLEFVLPSAKDAEDLITYITECSQERAAKLVSRRFADNIGPASDPYGYGGSETVRVRVLPSTYSRVKAISENRIIAMHGDEAYRWSLESTEGVALRALADRA